MKFYPYHFLNQWLWGNVLLVCSPVYSFFSPFSMTMTPFPLQHLQSFSPLNNISAFSTFFDVASSFPLVVEFVLSSGLLDSYLVVFPGLVVLLLLLAWAVRDTYN